MQTIHVSTSHPYDVLIGAGIMDETGAFVRKLFPDARVFVATDSNVGPLYLDRVLASLGAAGIGHDSIILPAGEPTKSMPYLQQLYTAFHAAHITRSDLILALGGGVIGDLTGFAAATWLRGLPFVQIPTTLLSQVDSSVGGKVAIDLPQGKNLVGAFHQPSLVLCDPLSLSTLTDHFWKDGMGEVVKYGCIGDPELFDLLSQCAPLGREGLMQHMETILLHCIQYKADVVARDEFDRGERMTLNFGHTLAHAIETCQNYAGLSHGMAVSVGMAGITRVSEDRGITEDGTYDRLTSLLTRLGLPCEVPDLPAESLLTAMRSDKKNAGTSLRLIVLDRIGQCRVMSDSPEFYRPFLEKHA